MMVYDKKAVEEKRQGKVPYDYYRSIFKDLDPNRIQENTGCIYNSEENELIVEVMGKKAIVKFPSGYIYNEDYSEMNNYSIKILVIRYLINAKAVEPFNKDITYRDVPGGNVYYPNFYGRCIARLARTFANDLVRFEGACKRIGGERVSLGDIAYKIEFMHNVFITFILMRRTWLLLEMWQ